MVRFSLLTGRIATTPSTLGLLEPALGAIAALQLFFRRDAIRRDRLQAARGELADERLLAGDAQRVVLRDDERGDFLAGEAHRRRVGRSPRPT